jgi:competence protein ComEA
MLRIACSSVVLAALATLFAAIPSVAAQAKPQTAAKSGSTQIVNVNTASAADFEALPGIGPKMAARIIEYRQKNGPFKKVEELMNVRGLGEKNFLKLKAQLTIGAPSKPSDRTQ